MTLPAIAAVPGAMGIYRLPAHASVAPALTSAAMTFVSRTDEELSIVCPVALAEAQGLTAATAADCQSAPWSCLKVAGPIDFAVVGVMAKISTALAAADISLFALSTFDTDYVLVRSDQLNAALAQLQQAGFPSG